MNKLLRHVLLSIFVALFFVSTQVAANTKQPDLINKSIEGRIAILDVHCVLIPYTGYQLARERDLFMNFNIEWILRGNIPTAILNNKFVDVKLFADDTAPSSQVCIYYMAPVFSYKFN